MAEKQIKGQEIIEKDHLADARKSAESLLTVYKELDEQIKKTAESSKKMVGSADTSTVKGIKQLNEELTKSKSLKESSIKLEQDEAKVKQQLKQLTDEEVKAKIRLQEANKKQRDILKDVVALENKEIGTLQKLQIENRKLTKERATLNLETEKGRKRLQEINKTLDQNNLKIRQNTDALGKQRLNIGNYQSALKGATNTLKSFASAMGLVGGVTLFVNVLKDAFNIVKDFDKASANLSAILGKNREDITALTEDAKRLGSVTKFTATQVAELQTELAKLGFSEEEILKATGSILALASATNTELAQAASQVGATIRAFNLDASEAGRVADVFALATSKSALSMEFLNTAMSTVAPVSASFGFSVENTTALLGKLADSGFDASSSATATRNILLNLVDTNGKLAKSLSTPITDLESLTKGLAELRDSGIDLADALELTDKRSVSAFNTFLQNAEGVQDLSDALDKAKGSAQNMADTQLKSLDGALAELNSAWEGLILQMESGEGVMGNLIISMIDIAKSVLSILSGTNELSQAFLNLPYGKVVKGFLELKDMIGKTFNSFEDFSNTLVKVGATMMRMLSFGLLNKVADGIEKQYEATKKLSKEQEQKLRTDAKSLEMGRELINMSKAQVQQGQILIESLMDENRTREEKIQAFEKLQELYPELLANIDLESVTTEQLIEIKKKLVEQILTEMVEKRKLAALDSQYQKLIQNEIDMVLANSENRRNQLRKDREEIIYTIEQINKVADKVSGQVGNIVEQMDLSKPMTNNIAKIDELNKQIDDLEKKRKVASKEQQTEIDKNINARKKQIAELKAMNDKMFKDALGLEDKVTGSGKTSSNSSTKSGKSKAQKELEDAEKERQRQREKELEDLMNLYNEIEKLENAHLDSFLTAQQVEENAIRDKYFTQIELAKKNNIDTTILEESLQRELQAIRDKYEDERRKAEEEKERQQEEAYFKRLKAEEELAKKILEANKKLVQDTLDMFNIMVDNMNSKMDSQIQNAQDRITASESRINDMKSEAQAGNLDAQESIKLEQQRIANEKANIETLEKKKRNLLILTTALQLANTKIQAGDGNGLANATSQMQSFIQGLQGFYDGTDTTLGESISDAYRIKGDKDTHIIKAHEDEMIIGVNNSRKLKGMSQDDVVNGALLYKNQELLNKRAVTRYNHATVMSDSRIVSELQQTREAIKSIDIPKYDFKFNEIDKIFTETIKTKQRIDNNNNKLGGCFS